MLRFFKRIGGEQNQTSKKRQTYSAIITHLKITFLYMPVLMIMCLILLMIIIRCYGNAKNPTQIHY